MDKFEILDHKGDIKIRVVAETKEEVFSNALLGMKEILSPELLDELIDRQIEIHSIDLSTLLIDFLNEAIYLGQSKKESYDRFDIKELTEDHLVGDLMGFRAKRFNNEIRSATYHQLKFNHLDNGQWEAIIIFDV